MALALVARVGARFGGDGDGDMARRGRGPGGGERGVGKVWARVGVFVEGALHFAVLMEA